MIPVKFVWEMQAGRDIYQMDHLGPRSFFAYGDQMEMEQSKLGQKNVIRPSYKKKDKTWIHKQKWFFTKIPTKLFLFCTGKKSRFDWKENLGFFLDIQKFVKSTFFPFYHWPIKENFRHLKPLHVCVF